MVHFICKVLVFKRSMRNIFQHHLRGSLGLSSLEALRQFAIANHLEEEIPTQQKRLWDYFECLTGSPVIRPCRVSAPSGNDCLLHWLALAMLGSRLTYCSLTLKHILHRSTISGSGPVPLLAIDSHCHRDKLFERRCTGDLNSVLTHLLYSLDQDDNYPVVLRYSITHHVLSPPPSHHHLYIIHLINWLQRFYHIIMSLKRPFVPKSDVKQWFTTTTTT